MNASYRGDLRSDYLWFLKGFDDFEDFKGFKVYLELSWPSKVVVSLSRVVICLFKVVVHLLEGCLYLQVVVA